MLKISNYVHSKHNYISITILVFAIFMIASILCVVFFIIFPWSHMCCTELEIDIKSGRIRNSNYLLFYSTKQTTDDSILTTVLTKEDLRSDTPDWRRINTLPLGSWNSPSYAFHGALFEINEVRNIWDTVNFSPEAKREIVQTILNLWQASGTDDGSFYYIKNLREFTEICKISGKLTIDKNDITSVSIHYTDEIKER